MTRTIYKEESRPHESAKKHITGLAIYTDDMVEPTGLLHAAIGFSSKARANIKKINLCGYSLGGRLSIAFAKKYPDLINSLVLESCSLGIETIDEKEKKYSDDLLDIEKIKNNYKNFIKEWEEKSLFKTQKINNKKEWNSQKEIRKNHNNAQLAKSLEVFSQGNMRYYKNEYIDFNFPISIINGSHDNKYVKIGKKIAYLNRNAKQYIVNNSGHNTHLEQPELFLDILNESIYK